LKGRHVVSKRLFSIFMFLLLLLTTTLGSAQEAMTLNECVQLALTNNHALQAQRLDLMAKESLAEGTRGLAGPRIDFAASYQWQEDPTAIIPAHGPTIPAIYDDRQKLWGFNLYQNIYDAGKNKAIINLSNDTVHLQRCEIADQELSLVGNVVKEFYKVIQLNDNIKAQQDVVNALDSLLNDTHSKLQLGRVAEVDSLQVEAQFLAEKEKFIRYQSERDRQLSLLKAAIGVGQLQNINLLGMLKDYEFNTPIATDISHNLEIQKASIRKTQSEELLKSTKADNAVQFSLNGQYNIRSVGKSGVPQDEMWIVAAQAKLPIFDGGVIAANIRQAKLQVKNNAESYAQIANDVEANAYSAHLSADAAGVRVEAGRLALDCAQEAYRIVELSYRVGKASVTDLLFAQATLTNAQATYYQAIFDHISAVIDLKMAYGQKVF
jgi:outer membrane protein